MNTSKLKFARLDSDTSIVCVFFLINALRLYQLG
jgi:hypothetical protein